MNKFVDDKGLKRYTDNMKLLLKKKVSKKRPYGQIVIGKSINPKSYDWGTIYAFRGHPCITVWSNNKVETFNIIIRDDTGTDVSNTYQSSGIALNNTKAKYSHLIHLIGYPKIPCGFSMFNPYTNGDTTIHLLEIQIPTINLTGTSKKYSWVNMKRVISKKGTFEQACEILRYRFDNITPDASTTIVKAYKSILGNVLGVPYWKHGVFRGKPYRDKFPNKKKKYTRFTRKASGLGGGLWLVRFYDRRSKTYMNNVKVYVRKTKEGKLIFKRT
ncbi:hypothetical protein [Prevotella sp.]|nr:hypothetical protein [Prevotella sp.]